MSGLRPCPNCGKQIPDDADVCSRCGAPNLQSKWAFRHDPYWRELARFAVAVVFVAAVVAIIAAVAWWAWRPRP